MREKLWYLRCMMVAKRKNKTYNVRMKRTNIFKPHRLENLLDVDYSSWSGHEITELLLAIHDNYNYFVKTKQSPEMILYYHDILSRLVKTYGH